LANLYSTASAAEISRYHTALRVLAEGRRTDALIIANELLNSSSARALARSLMTAMYPRTPVATMADEFAINRLQPIDGQLPARVGSQRRSRSGLERPALGEPGSATGTG
jgi:hypothetical protein